MKIKTDFVTNSSSVAYIVMIPDSFYPDDHEIQEVYNDRLLYYEPPLPTKEKVLNELYECIKIIKEGDNIWHYGAQGVSQIVYYMTADICYNHDFVLSTIDISNEGNNIIQGVKEEVIENMIINNIDIMSIFKLIQRENKSDTSKTK